MTKTFKEEAEQILDQYLELIVKNVDFTKDPEVQGQKVFKGKQDALAKLQHLHDAEVASARLDELDRLLSTVWSKDKTLDFPLLSGDPWQVMMAKRIEELASLQPDRKDSDE